MIVLAHGIRTSDPEATMGGLQLALAERGRIARFADYGYIAVPLDNGRAKRAIQRLALPGCTLVGFSNGGLAVHQTAEAVDARHVVLISPALRRDVKWPNCVESVTVFYSPGDKAVWLGGMWSGAASLMPWRWGTPHGWGRMGLDGPDTNDPRVRAVKMGDDIAHSWHQYPDKVEQIASAVAALD